MARSRNIKPAICLNDVLAEFAHWVRLLFIYLWTIADRAGRLSDNPKRIGAALFPYEPGLPFDEGLQRLEDGGFIHRYSVAGEPYIQILAWEKHQRPHHQEAKSEIPPPEAVRAVSRSTPENIRTTSHQGASLSRSYPEPIRLIPDTGYLIPDSLSPDSGENGEGGLPEFLAAYPKRTKQDSAARAYLSVINRAEDHQKLMDGLKRWLGSDQWERSLEADGGRFVPDPDRFLFDRLFLDDPPAHRETPKDGGAIDEAVRLYEARRKNHLAAAVEDVAA